MTQPKIAALLSILFAAFARPAAAQDFTLRLGADVRPLVATTAGVGTSIADYGWIGLDIAPGLKLAKVFTVELNIQPQIPINKSSFQLVTTPDLVIDLWLLYVRAGAPIRWTDSDLSRGVTVGLEAAAGLSFLQSGYLGAVVNHWPNSNSTWLGAEAGWRF